MKSKRPYISKKYSSLKMPLDNAEDLGLTTPPLINCSTRSSFPSEIVDMILTELSAQCAYNKNDMLSFARVCRSWNAIAISLLYHTMQPRLYRNLRQMELTLRRKPQLGGYVRKLMFPQLLAGSLDGFGDTISPRITQWGMPLAPV